MRLSQSLMPTLKEVPSDAVIVSHQLLLRAGMIRKLASGLYNWLPMGYRVLQKVEKIVREEMNRSGAQELLMPAVQPAELWQDSGRWQQYGPELLRVSDRHQREFCIGPTHEEVITDIARNELKSYRQLPQNFYQMQTKFRDEIRPRFGLMRAREFIMKDSYSFHANAESLDDTYQVMHDTYHRIFNRLGLEFRAVFADSGSIGGNSSQEFHVLAESGEDAIAFSDTSNFAANIEATEALLPETPRPPASQELKTLDTPNCRSIEDVANFFSVSADKTVKTLIVKGDAEDAPFVALVLRGDHTLNDIKTENLAGILSPLEFASEEEVKSLGTVAGSCGPVGLSIPVIVDRSASVLADFICGANAPDKHLTGVNWERDCPLSRVEDLRNIQEGDPSPDGQGSIVIKRGIEVGHIFKLGTKYSEAMNAEFLDQDGKTKPFVMGCYGLGVTRVVAAAIEQNFDDNGIIWPASIAPFQIVIIPMRADKSERVQTTADDLYQRLTAEGYDVLYDDRDKKTSPGVRFADAELIGIPLRIVVSDRALADDNFEVGIRKTGEKVLIPVAELDDFLSETLSEA